MLLIGCDSRSFAYIKCLTVDIFIIRVIRNKCTYCKIRNYIITGFTVSAPTACLVGKAIAERSVNIPVDIEIHIVYNLGASQ